MSLIAVIVLVVACSPQTQRTTGSTSQVPAPTATSEAVVQTGTFTYAVGKVEVETSGTWTLIEIGDTVSVDTNVRTGPKSVCDIQFARLGVVHLAESTELSLKTIGISSKKRAVDLELLTGAVTAKVSKLLGDDRFQVKTDTVVCGVRGTRFVVTKTPGSPTTIAVAEGSVALLPPSYDAQKFDSLASSPEKAALVQTVKASIINSATAVGVGSQVVVSRDSLEKPAEAVAKIEASLEEIPPAPVGGAAAPLVLPESVSQALDTYQKAVPGPATPVPQPQSRDTEKILSETEGLHVEETLPESALPVSAPATAHPSALVLASPRLITPASGESVNIKKQESIRFTWKTVTGATEYEVTLFQDKDKSPIKSWTTQSSTVILDRFTGLQEGVFRWQVVAVNNDDPPIRSVPASSVFRIVKGSQLSAPAFDVPTQE